MTSTSRRRRPSTLIPRVRMLGEPSSGVAEEGAEAEASQGEKRELDADDEVLPEAKRSRLEMLELYMAKVNALTQARQRKEVQIKGLSDYNQKCFTAAMKKEIDNNLQTGAYEFLTLEESARIRQTDPDKVMESRYVVTAKPLELTEVDAAREAGLLLDWDGPDPCKAKVRHVMKGFSEEGAELLAASTPQVTREGMITVAQLVASHRWRLGFLDFTQAFHAGDKIQRTLYCEQSREGVPGMVPGQLLKLLKTCYGLTDGPYAWYQHITRILKVDLKYTQSISDPCVFYLHDEDGNGQKKLVGAIALATDDMPHGGGDRHQANMEWLRSKYKMGKFQFDQGKFTGKTVSMQLDGSISFTQEGYPDQIPLVPLTPSRKKQRYSFCTADEISGLRATLGGLSWISKETRPDLSGRVALLQQCFPKPRVLALDLVEANALVSEARAHATTGFRIMPILPERLRVGVISDASWGNAKDRIFLEDNKLDSWEETTHGWKRHHRAGRRTLFHPGASDGGPDLQSLLPSRTTTSSTGETVSDEWNASDGVREWGDSTWTGTTEFTKRKDGSSAPHSEINDTFLRLLCTSSQGGYLVIFYDSLLETSSDPQMISLATWKSTRLERKTVNTLSAECQAMIQAVGNVHWFRFMLNEAAAVPMDNESWEQTLASVPYVAVTDSKSLYDCMSKLVCTYTQCEDKRTAIDVAILKDDLVRSAGHVRWVEGKNMLSDCLTKKMCSHFLRSVVQSGHWALSEEGHQKQLASFDTLLLIRR